MNFVDSMLTFLGIENRKKTTKPVFVNYVVDGDTFDANIGGMNYRCRLACLDTPERGHPRAKEATELLKAMINKKEIGIFIYGKDKYNRLIVEAYEDHTDSSKRSVNSKMILSGFAKVQRYKDVNMRYTHTDKQYLFHKIEEFRTKLNGKHIW